MTALGELVVSSPVEPWVRMGLLVHGHHARVGGVRMRFVPGDAGLVGWGLVDAPDEVDSIDGLATTHVPAPDGHAPEHPLRVIGFDHVVVMTSSLERTCTAIHAATGEELRRVREAGPVRQGFHRLGEVVVEVVESDKVTAPAASFWGFVWNVAELHDLCEELGPDVLSPAKPAVQSGRWISTVRADLGLGVPLALMSPR